MATTTETTTETGWQLADSAADAYERYLVPVIFTELAERLVTAAAVAPGERVLDAACGTGVVARAASRRVGASGKVTAVDVNPDMLSTARRVAATDIEFVQADITALPFEDDTFDVALCEEALQFVADPTAVLRELARVTVPDGRLGVSVFRGLDRHEVYATFARVLGEHAGPDAETMMRSPFAFGDAERLRAVAGDAGLVDVDIRIGVGSERFASIEEFVRQEAASSPLAGPLAAVDPDRRAALVDDLTAALADHLDDGGLVFPNETQVLTARVV